MLINIGIECNVKNEDAFDQNQLSRTRLKIDDTTAKSLVNLSHFYYVLCLNTKMTPSMQILGTL